MRIDQRKIAIPPERPSELGSCHSNDRNPTLDYNRSPRQPLLKSWYPQTSRCILPVCLINFPLFTFQVVLAASICTRGGKAVLSRQFRPIPRSRIEGLLASFPKLADSSTQHTTVEADNVRYVYQPLDELFLLLITNRQSNILQDIDSLHLFAQVVTTVCTKGLDEREILRNAYELLSAFDELVTLGYRENLSIGQIKTFLEMESHEERIQEIISRVCAPWLFCFLGGPYLSLGGLNYLSNITKHPNSSDRTCTDWVLGGNKTIE